MISKDEISALVAEHDDNPVKVAGVLRNLQTNDVLEDDLTRITWLITHVIGEKMSAWPEALSLQAKLIAGRFVRTVPRDYAVTAYLAGSPMTAWQSEEMVAFNMGCDAAQANILVRLGVLQMIAGQGDFLAVCKETRKYSVNIRDWELSPALARALGINLNNIVSALLDRNDADPRDDEYRYAMMEGSRSCRTAWEVGGDWMNHERADYLIAMCSNRIGAWHEADEAATRALRIIADNGEEDVDVAFISLELSRAKRNLGDAAGADQNYTKALELAAAFSEPGLDTWFESRRLKSVAADY